jgi:hypothetical protein
MHAWFARSAFYFSGALIGAAVGYYPSGFGGAILGAIAGAVTAFVLRLAFKNFLSAIMVAIAGLFLTAAIYAFWNVRL